MAAPNLPIKTKLGDMVTGDAIICEFNATNMTFSNLGTSTAVEIPYGGLASGVGSFYFIKSDKGKLIADRIVRNNISWVELNTNYKLIQLRSFDAGVKGFTTYLKLSTCTFQSGAFIITELGGAHLGGYICIDLTDACGFKDTDVVEITYTEWNNGHNSNGSGCNHFQITNKAARSPNIYYFYDDAPLFQYTTPGYNSVWNTYVTTIDFAKKISSITRDGVAYTTGTFATYTPGTDNRYHVTFGQHDYASTYTYKVKDITIKVNGTLVFDSNDMDLTDFFDMGVRSITGGCAYLGLDGKPSITDQNLGAWPPNNEHDTYIVKSSLDGKITPGDDNIWHWSKPTDGSWVQETPILAWKAADRRVLRGGAKANMANYNLGNGAGTNIGYRPVLVYDEYEKASSIWY